MLKDSQLANERLQKEYSLLVEKVAKLQGTLEEHVHTNTQVWGSVSREGTRVAAVLAGDAGRGWHGCLPKERRGCERAPTHVLG